MPKGGGRGEVPGRLGYVSDPPVLIQRGGGSDIIRLLAGEKQEGAGTHLLGGLSGAAGIFAKEILHPCLLGGEGGVVRYVTAQSTGGQGGGDRGHSISTLQREFSSI